jgi:hypothetical protein
LVFLECGGANFNLIDLFFFSFFCDKASLQQACERIEQRDSASSVFTSVMEGTGLHRTADADFADLINALSTNSELANVPSLSIIILKVTWAVTTSLCYNYFMFVK